MYGEKVKSLLPANHTSLKFYSILFQPKKYFLKSAIYFFSQLVQRQTIKIAAAHQ